jgi:methyl-accepting chemotaxis protein
MNSFFSRIVGVLMVIAAIFGLIFSGWGLVRIWTIKNQVAADILSTIELTHTTLEATSDGLFLAEQSLTQAKVDVISLKNTLEATGRAIRATNPIISSLSNLMANDLPDAIEATQMSLETAQSSARLIESFLRTLSSIPFLPIEPYDPQVPLQESLGEVSASLEGIPESLLEMDENLGQSQGNLILIQAEFNIMARHVEQINESLTNAETIVMEYQEVISELQERTSNLEDDIPQRINNLVWWLTFILIWLAITQIGLLLQGISLLAGGRQVARVEKVVVEKLVEKEDVIEEVAGGE